MEILIRPAFQEELRLGKDGLPVAEGEGHGIGLASVMNTVKRYSGSMSISTEESTFSVNIILYCDR